MEAGSAIRVLLVEDSTTQARFIQQTLTDMGRPGSFEVTVAQSLAEGLGQIEARTFDVVLLDLVLPDSEGLATFQAVQLACPEQPVIVLSGQGDDTVALSAVSEGAQDYLAKSSLSPELLARSIRYAVERHRVLDQLRRVALFDDLTGVYNRRGFLFLAEQQLAVVRRTGTPVTILFVDVDGLKSINDGLGHHEGDQALVEVAEIMTATFRTSDVIGRVGGDEFCAVVLDDSPAGAAVDRFRRALDDRNADKAQRFPLSCSVGSIETDPGDPIGIADLLLNADQAMYDDRHVTRRPRVLVVDDDEAVRVVIEQLLADDYDVTTTGSGAEALRMAMTHPPSLVLVDIGLPDVDGRSLVRDLRTDVTTRAVRIIVMTADDRDTTELSSFRAGAEAFLVKPIEATTLREGVDRALGRVRQR